jgi:hypothetical protein
LVRARRRRRAEVSGEPLEVRPSECFTDGQDGPLSISDILRSGRRRVTAPNEGRARIATDINEYRSPLKARFTRLYFRSDVPASVAPAGKTHNEAL